MVYSEMEEVLISVMNKAWLLPLILLLLQVQYIKQVREGKDEIIIIFTMCETKIFKFLVLQNLWINLLSICSQTD